MSTRLPRGMPTCDVTYRGLVTVEESRFLDRYRLSTHHLGASGEWIADSTHLLCHPPDSVNVTELETALVSPLEAFIMSRWGIQTLLL